MAIDTGAGPAAALLDRMGVAPGRGWYKGVWPDACVPSKRGGKDMRRPAVRRPRAARVWAPLALVLGFLTFGLSATGSAWAAESISAPQGATITISGMVSPSSACPGGTPVQLTSTPASGTTNLFPGGLGPQVPRDAAGNFKATFTIPAATPVGSYTIGVRCGSAAAVANQTLMVTAAPTSPGGPQRLGGDGPAGRQRHVHWSHTDDGRSIVPGGRRGATDIDVGPVPPRRLRSAASS